MLAAHGSLRNCSRPHHRPHLPLSNTTIFYGVPFRNASTEQLEGSLASHAPREVGSLPMHRSSVSLRSVNAGNKLGTQTGIFVITHCLLGKRKPSTACSARYKYFVKCSRYASASLAFCLPRLVEQEASKNNEQ